MKITEEKLREIIEKAEKATPDIFCCACSRCFEHQNFLNDGKDIIEFRPNPDTVKSICQELLEAREALKFYAEGAGNDVVDEEQNYSTHNVAYKNDFSENGKMDLKKIMNSRDLKQRDLVKGVNVDTSRISMQINGVRPLPKKYHDAFCKLLGITKEQLENFNKKGGNHGI